MSTFKMLTNNDVIDSRTSLYEAIPITGSIISGTYGGATVVLGQEPNIKTYKHGQFQSVYDYPYLSSSANHIFDITCGMAPASGLSSSTTSQLSKKINIYNQMAQVLVGYDLTGTVGRFDLDGSSPGVGDEANKMNEVFFINYSRLLTKDEIKKGRYELELGVGGTFDQAGALFGSRIKITDVSGSKSYFKNSPAGEYGVLYATASAGTGVLSASLANDGLNQPACGLIYYQAGIAVLSGSVFTAEGKAVLANAIDTTGADNAHSFTMTVPDAAGGDDVTHIFLYETTTDVNNNEVATTFGISTQVASTDALLAAATIDAINGVVNSAVKYGAANIDAGSTLTAGTLGLTAKQGDSDTEITLTMDFAGGAGNVANVLNAVEGFAEGSLLIVTSFLGGGSTTDLLAGGVDMSSEGGLETISDMLTGSTIDATANSIRNRMYNTQFNNTTELNSAIYWCRANHNDFNYSSNPTYLSGSQIRVKETSIDTPITYITTVGLYSEDNELLAVAKLSEPIKKTPEIELTLRVRLDY